MSDEAQRTGGVFIPYPLLAIILTLTTILGGGLIGLYAQVNTMNQRDSDRDQLLKKLEDKLDLMNMYITDLREKQARREGSDGQAQRR